MYEQGRGLLTRMNKDNFERFLELQRIKAEKNIKYRTFIDNLMIHILENPIKMSTHNPGYDWICKRGYKIDNKSRCLNYTNKAPNWLFHIRCNNIADWFILYGWDNVDSSNPLRIWAFHKNDIVRDRKFSEFDTFSITNTPEKLKELEKYEFTNKLDKLKEILIEKLKGTNDSKNDENDDI